MLAAWLCCAFFQDTDPEARVRTALEQGSIDAVDPLIRAANSGGPDAPKFNQALDQAATQALPQQGYGNTRLSLLVASSIRCKDYSRAERYLAGAIWHPGTADEGKTPAHHAATVIRLVKNSSAKTFDAVACVACYTALSQGAVAPDSVTVDVLRENLINVGVAAVRFGNIDELVGQTRSSPGAAAFWGAISDQLLKAKSPHIDPYVRSLAKAYAAHFDSAFECKMCMALADMPIPDELVVPVRRDPMRKVKLLRTAFDRAPTDALRGEALKKLGKAYCEIRDYKRALEAVEGGILQVNDATLRQELETLVIEIKVDQEGEQLRSVAEKKQLLVDQVQGRLDKSRAWLETMKKQNRPVEDIQKCEEQIRLFEQELETLKQR
jgi:hypothetical protein